MVAALLLFAVELWLHTDAFLYRYRSVFAAGRALDKTRYAEAHCPPLLVLGNSRADNGFDPRTIRRHLEVPIDREGFNLGIPGADSRVLAGILDRLDAAGCLRTGGVRYVVLSLDEALVQAIDSLGQEVFFADARRMWADRQHRDALRAVLRLYGYSTNLRQLREPATLQRFVQATLYDADPVGGGAALHLGYRAGFGGFCMALILSLALGGDSALAQGATGGSIGNDNKSLSGGGSSDKPRSTTPAPRAKADRNPRRSDPRRRIRARGRGR